jgi:hypothetical protein
MGSRVIESAAYCFQIWPAQLYIKSAQNTSVNVIAVVSTQSYPIKRRTLYFNRKDLLPRIEQIFRLIGIEKSPHEFFC